jgi:hypothetical protein
MSTPNENKSNKSDEPAATKAADVPEAPTSSHDRISAEDDGDWVMETINGARINVLRDKQLRRVLVG